MGEDPAAAGKWGLGLQCILGVGRCVAVVAPLTAVRLGRRAPHEHATELRMVPQGIFARGACAPWRADMGTIRLRTAP